MSEHDARDPYLGLNAHIRQQAREQLPTYYTVGKVVSLRPLTIRAAGMNLTKEDLRIAQHLAPSWKEPLSELAWPLTAKLPRVVFTGSCSCSAGAGTCQVTRPEETINGATVKQATVTHPNALLVGDEVVLIPSSDCQTYYVVEKFVGVDE